MPEKTFLTTVGEQDAKAARRRLWHLLLEGDKGCIVWWSEDCIDWKSDDYALTPRAKALAPVLKEMQSPLAHLFMRAEREYDPIAIHYSQASIQVDWLLESTEDGSTWLRRFSSYEAGHNKMARVRNAWLKAFQDLGYSPRFISSQQILQGELKNDRVLVLPYSFAVSDKEAEAIAGFQKRDQCTIFYDHALGAFDSHGRLCPTSLVTILYPTTPEDDSGKGYSLLTASKNASGATSDDISAYRRKTGFDAPLWIEENLPDALNQQIGMRAALWTQTSVHRYQLGSARLVAFERNITWQMSEDLKQAGGNDALEKPVTFEAKLVAPSHVYDLRAGKYIGLLEKIPVDLDPWQPSLYALTKSKLPDGDVIAELEKLAPH